MPKTLKSQQEISGCMCELSETKGKSWCLSTDAFFGFMVRACRKQSINVKVLHSYSFFIRSKI